MVQSSLHCPRCRVALQPREVAGHVVHGCPACGGLWLDVAGSNRVTTVLCSATLAAADEASRVATHSPDTQLPDLPCPVCSQPMTRRHVDRARVDLDDCPQHGTWFDRGELQTVARSVAAVRAYGGAATGQPVQGGHLAAATSVAGVGVGAAVVGGAMAHPAVQHQVRGHAQPAIDTAGDIALGALELVDAGDVVEGLGVAGHVAGEVAGGLASGGAELAGDALGVVAEGAGGLLGGAFELIGAIFEGLC